MKILDEITEAWEKAKADVVRPMECPFDYFGEGYLAAHLSQNVEIQRLTAIIAAAPETVADTEHMPSEEMITAYMQAQHQYCHEADLRGAVEYARRACEAGLKAALRSRN